MADDSVDVNVTPVAQPEKKVGPTELTIAVRNPDGSMRVAKKNAKGQFIKVTKKMPATLEVTRNLRNFLNSNQEVDSDGKMTKSAKSVLRNIQENLVRMAMYKGSDPKMAQVGVAAAELLWKRAHGDKTLSDQEMGLLEKTGVRIVVVSAPELMHPEIQEEKPKEQLKPSFIEAEFVTND